MRALPMDINKSFVYIHHNLFLAKLESHGLSEDAFTQI